MTLVVALLLGLLGLVVVTAFVSLALTGRSLGQHLAAVHPPERHGLRDTGEDVLGGAGAGVAQVEHREERRHGIEGIGHGDSLSGAASPRRLIV